MGDFLQRVEQRWQARDMQLLATPADRLVGCVGLDVPLELIEAAGFVAVPLRVDAATTPEGALRFGSDGHPVLRALIGELQSGCYRHLRNLVIGTTPRYLQSLYSFHAGIGAGSAAPSGRRLHLFDVARGASDSAQHYNSGSLQDLRDTLADWSGRAFDAAALRAAISRHNALRQLLRQLDRQRARRAGLSGELALKIHIAALLPEAEEFLPALADWLGEEPAPVAPAAALVPGILYSGSTTGSPELYQRIEAVGLRVVADDQELGSRAVGLDLDESLEPMAALLLQLQHRAPAPAGWSMAQRQLCVLQQVADSGARGVLFATAAYDHPGGWDFPALRDTLDRSGIPHASADPYYYRDPALLGRAAQALAGKLQSAAA